MIDATIANELESLNKTIARYRKVESIARKYRGVKIVLVEGKRRFCCEGIEGKEFETRVHRNELRVSPYLYDSELGVRLYTSCTDVPVAKVADEEGKFVAEIAWKDRLGWHNSKGIIVRKIEDYLKGLAPSDAPYEYKDYRFRSRFVAEAEYPKPPKMTFEDAVALVDRRIRELNKDVPYAKLWEREYASRRDRGESPSRLPKPVGKLRDKYTRDYIATAFYAAKAHSRGKTHFTRASHRIDYNPKATPSVTYKVEDPLAFQAKFLRNQAKSWSHWKYTDEEKEAFSVIVDEKARE